MNNKLIAIGYKGCAFLPEGATVQLVKLNGYNVIKWQKPGAQARAFQSASLSGKPCGSVAHDLCLFVGKSQFGHCPNPTHKEVWIGELEVARKRKLVVEAEFSFRGKRVTGYVAHKVIEPAYIATDALASGRIETDPLTDNNAFDRNSSIYESLKNLQLKRYRP